MDPWAGPGKPRWVRGSTIDPEERIMRQAGGKQTPEGPLGPHSLVDSHGLLQLRVSGRAIAAVADGASSHAPSHAAEHSRAAELLAGREELRRCGWGEAEVGSSGWYWRGTLGDASTCEEVNVTDTSIS